MSKNRKAPAYQEYAADMLSNLQFRTMSLQARGLLYTMRLECWANGRLPSSAKDLASVLGKPVSETESSLDAVMPFFEVADGFIFSAELDGYRAHLENRKNKEIEDGKKGAAVTNAKRKRSTRQSNKGVSGTPSGTPSSTPSGTPSGYGRGLSTVESSTAKQSQEQNLSPLGNSIVLEPFVLNGELH